MRGPLKGYGSFNPKKYGGQRRRRPSKSVATAKIAYLEVPRKSKSGKSYTRVKEVLTRVSRVEGSNRAQKRADGKWAKGKKMRDKKFRVLNARAKDKATKTTSLEAKANINRIMSADRKKKVR